MTAKNSNRAFRESTERAHFKGWCSYLGSSAVLLLMAACGSGSTASQSDAQADAQVDAGAKDAQADGASAAPVIPTVKLDWKSCPLITDGKGSAAECATTKVPLYYDDPKSKTLPLFVKRIPASKPRRGQLWLLNGGPGYSGAAANFETNAQLIHQQVPDLDIYIPDHRGTGRSNFFECSDTWSSEPDIVVELDVCAEELQKKFGSGTSAYRTTNAALDVATLIASTRDQNDQVIVYGGSYGGYWLHRLLQIAPDAVSAAVFESSTSGNGWDNMLDVITAPSDAGKGLLDLCTKDAACKQRLGDDPNTFARTALDTYEAQCPDLPSMGWDRTTMQAVLTSALDDVGHRSLLPAAFARIARCNADDVAWVDSYLQFVILEGGVTQPTPHPSAPSSRALYYHIGISELFGAASDRATLTNSLDNTLFSAGFNDLHINDAFSTWPVYAPDDYQQKAARFTSPVLILHGALDARTPLSMGRALAAELSGPNQTLVVFPTAPHGVQLTTAATDSGLTCGETVLLSFLTDPTVKPDTACVKAETTIDFSAHQDLVDQFAAGMGIWE